MDYKLIIERVKTDLVCSLGLSCQQFYKHNSSLWRKCSFSHRGIFLLQYHECPLRIIGLRGEGLSGGALLREDSWFLQNVAQNPACAPITPSGLAAAPLCAAVDWSTVPATMLESNTAKESRVHAGMNSVIVADAARSPVEKLEQEAWTLMSLMHSSLRKLLRIGHIYLTVYPLHFDRTLWSNNLAECLMAHESDKVEGLFQVN